MLRWRAHYAFFVDTRDTGESRLLVRRSADGRCAIAATRYAIYTML